MQVGQVLATALAVLGFAAGAAASLHALHFKRRPQSAFAWIAVCLTLPLFGALLYYLFGINRVQTRAAQQVVIAATRQGPRLRRSLELSSEARTIRILCEPAV